MSSKMIGRYGHIARNWNTLARAARQDGEIRLTGVSGRLRLTTEERGVLLLKDSGDARTNDDKLLIKKKARN